MSSLRSLTLGDVLTQVGAKTPAPGGGAVASVTGALAASLAKMVVSYSVGKKSLAEHQPALERAGHVLGRTADLLLELSSEDAAAYSLVNELGRLPEADARRVREYPAAVRAAVNVPCAVVAASADLLRLLESLQPITNKHLASDLAIAAVLAESAAKSGNWNVRVNLPLMKDFSARAKINAQMETLLAECAQRRARIEGACAGVNAAP